jgi:hypothetical protein
VQTPCNESRIEFHGLVDLFLDAHDWPPEEITLDIDPTNLETFGQQLGRHFQKHYDGYCDLPQYVFCGEFLLAAQLRPGDVGAMSGAMKLLPQIVTRIRQRWPDVRITIRGDGHFSDDRLMSWCEVERTVRGADQGSNGLTVEDNIVYHTLTGGLRHPSRPRRRRRSRMARSVQSLPRGAAVPARRFRRLGDGWRQTPAGRAPRNVGHHRRHVRSG